MKTTHLSTSPHGIELYQLDGKGGFRAQVINYGARILGLWVPTASGDCIDVLPGFALPDDYLAPNPYFNAVVGRVANRISPPVFELDGRRYPLECNEGDHYLHGGHQGFDSKMWSVIEAEGGAITLRYVSPDGEAGFPGNLTVDVTYRVHEDNSLTIDYRAIADADTAVSLTHHTYFNLDGDSDTVLTHEVRIASDAVLAVDDDLIVTGRLIPVEGTIYDFRTPKLIGRDLTRADPIVYGQGGYDHGYVLSSHTLDQPVATARGAHSGVAMDVYTDRQVLQFYSGNFLDGTLVGKRRYDYQSAFCMEAEDYTNALNVPSFPGVVLRAGQTYTAHTRYAFRLSK